VSELHLNLCRDCAGVTEAIAKDLQAAIDAALPDQVSLRLSACIALCDKPAGLTLQAAGGAGYAFAGIDPQRDVADIIATCQAYLDSPDGWIEDARPCGRLRFCLAARLPA